MKMLSIAAVIALGCCAVALAQDKPKVDPAIVDKTVAATFSRAPAEWQKRIEQDEAQRLCSQYRNELPAELFKKVVEAQKATIRFPEDGKFVGDWKAGQRVAQVGTGGQFSDGPNANKGGNCYACHQLSRNELSFGTMGPSLLEYGKIRNFSADDAKSAYAKIYNAQATMPCSNMPRFGHNQFLSEQQIKDAVAYLFDPDSPVNK